MFCIILRWSYAYLITVNHHFFFITELIVWFIVVVLAILFLIIIALPRIIIHLICFI